MKQNAFYIFYGFFVKISTSVDMFKAGQLECVVYPTFQSRERVTLRNFLKDFLKHAQNFSGFFADIYKF